MLFPNSRVPPLRAAGCSVLVRPVLVRAIWIVLLVSCKNFINLEPIGFSIYPGGDNTVLDTENTALSVRFDTAMDHLETRKALSVGSTGGAVRGDTLWQGDTLYFHPLEPWLPGVRYSLSLEGTIYALDGREDRVSKHVPFYALSREAAPYGLGFSPADGASVGVSSGGGAFVRIVFSRPMDRQSTADAFSLEGVGEKEPRWFDDDTVMEVHPKNSLAPWTVYRWTLSDKARSRGGVPLGKGMNGSFVTDADRVLPRVTEVYPLIRGGPESGSRWIKTGAAAENGLGHNQALGIEFNKAMDESVLRSVRFDPPLAGRTEGWTPLTVVFIPDRDPEPEKIYTLYVSADSRDTGGLAMAAEFSFSFTVDIPYLRVISLDAGRGNIGPVQNGSYPAETILPEGIITLALRFSHILEGSAQTAAVLAIRLEPYFPGTLAPVSLRSVRWWSGDTLIVQWEGIEQNVLPERHYYRLVLPGGRSGISDGRGSYLKEDMFFFIEGE